MRGQDLTQTGVGFQPDYATEGRFEALEFAAGNYGLLESAYDLLEGRQGPEVVMTGVRSSSSPITTTFKYVNEPAVIRYTTDGSKPSNTSTLWDSTGPREPGQSFVVTTTTSPLAGDRHGREPDDRQGDVHDQVGQGENKEGGPGRAALLLLLAAALGAAALVAAAVLIARGGGDDLPREAVDLGACRGLLADASQDCLIRTFEGVVEGRDDPRPAVAAIEAAVRAERGFVLSSCHGVMHTVGRKYAVDRA